MLQLVAENLEGKETGKYLQNEKIFHFFSLRQNYLFLAINKFITIY